jgi:serine protease inhibitor
MNSAVDVPDQSAAIAAASNRLTAEWSGRAEDGTSTVLSGAGVWPLLGLLALGADGETRAELAGAYGLDPGLGGAAARGFMELFDRAPALRAALGLWYKDDLTVRDTWLQELPPATHGRLTGDLRGDKERLDAWAREHTDGLIEQMPVVLSRATVLVLASAILVTTTWRQRFTETSHRAAAGPWAGRALAALTRQIPPESIRVIDGDGGEGDGDGDGESSGPSDTGPITTVVVEGEDDIDVLLFLGGPDVSAGKVLRAGITALAAGAAHGTSQLGTAAAELLGSGDAEPADDSRAPGVVVRTVQSSSPGPVGTLTTPRFTIHAEHDLLADPPLFGLAAASDADAASFPGMSPEPLVVSTAKQNAMAQFSATGFKAAAVTAVSMARAVAMHRNRFQARRIEVAYDRPFGFAAVHRTSGLIIAAGWVADV